RPVAEWVADLRAEDREKQHAAYEALLKAKPKSAVPALITVLGEKNAPVHYVAEILGTIGPDAKEAVPALLALVPKDGGFGSTETIAWALARIDGPKIETVRSLLLGTRRCVPNLLVGSPVLREYPGPVVRHLVALCGDKEPGVRERAAAFLGTLKEKEAGTVPPGSVFERAGDDAKGVAPALEKLLADENTEVRLAAARAISRVAPELAEKSLPVVVALGVRSTMTKHVLHITDIFNPVPQRAAKVLLPLFDDPNDGVRGWAITHVSALPTREPIEDALQSGKTARVRPAAAVALGSRYGRAPASVPALTAALADPDSDVRFAAAVALVQIGPRGSAEHTSALPVLVEGLRDRREDVRIAASQNLLQTGPTARTAIPALTKLLDDKSEEVRLEAALALVGIDPSKAAGGVPALVGGLKSENGNSVVRAAKALAVLGPVAKAAAPELLKTCGAEHPRWRLAAAEAVVRVDPAQVPKAVAVLVGLLKEEKARSVHRPALAALRHIGPGAKDAMPTLPAPSRCSSSTPTAPDRRSTGRGRCLRTRTTRTCTTWSSGYPASARRVSRSSRS
ncbi:MAG: HEAT repeat domain-containing protein, partial [Planctomycetes bacterium]|nr:HEAT repeat domain-containing protein [Planctomycetota bacterium]